MEEMTEYKKTQLNSVGFMKKMNNAKSDIDKIDEILADSSMFLHKANCLYDELNKNPDYAPYIFAAKIAKGMIGTVPFRNLSYYQKRTVFTMIKESIEVFVSKELTDKTYALKND